MDETTNICKQSDKSRLFQYVPEMLEALDNCTDADDADAIADELAEAYLDYSDYKNDSGEWEP